MTKPSACAVLCLLVVVGAGSSCAARRPAVTEPIRVYSGARSAVVPIGLLERVPGSEDRAQVRAWVGTGFIVEWQGLIATARHVVKDRANETRAVLEGIDPARMTRRDEERLAEKYPLFVGCAAVPNAGGNLDVVREVFEDPRLASDLAFLDVGPLGRTRCGRVTVILPLVRGKVSASALEGQRIVVLGFPMLKDSRDILSIPTPILKFGVIASSKIKSFLPNVHNPGPKLPNILLDLYSAPGFSGSPVLLEKTGEVIGVIYGPDQISREFGLTWAVPVNDETRAEARGWRRPAKRSR